MSLKRFIVRQGCGWDLGTKRMLPSLNALSHIYAMVGGTVPIIF